MSPKWQQDRVEDVGLTKDDGAVYINDTEMPSVSTDHQWGRKSQSRVDLHLLPVLFCLGIVVALDGANIGQARTRGLEHTLRMRKQDFSITAMAYYLPCIVLPVPCNIILHHCQKPPWFLASAVFICGVVTIGQGLTQSYAGLIVCRLLLGIFTTAFEAGAMNLLGSYYLGHTFHKRITFFLSGRLIASAFGGLLAYGLAHMDGIGGFEAWRWIFIIEGLLTALVGAISFPFQPRWPEQSVFRNPSERPHHHSDASALSSKSFAVKPGNTRAILSIIIRSPVVYFSGLIHFCCTTLSGSLVVFLPTILRSFRWSLDRTNYMTVPIFLTGAILAILNSAMSDWMRIRYPFCAGPILIAIVACIIPLADKQISPWASYAACICLHAGSFAAQTTGITWLGNNIYGRRQRGLALGVAAGFGNLGFILGSHIYLEEERPTYLTGHAVSLAVSCLALLSASTQVLYLFRRQKQGQGSKNVEEATQAGDEDMVWLGRESVSPGKIVY